jgi:hypothetical protein
VTSTRTLLCPILAFQWWPVKPVFGYACSAINACAFYVVCLFASATLDQASGPTANLAYSLGFAVFFCVFGGFLLATGLMIAPWILAVYAYRCLRTPAWLYYPVIGGMSTALIGCATSSLAPKPLFVDDQTFLEGAVIALERQGVYMLLAGLLFGLTYWFLSERRR